MRKSYCKEYIGEPRFGFDDLMQPIKVMRENKTKTKPLVDEEGQLLIDFDF